MLVARRELRLATVAEQPQSSGLQANHVTRLGPRKPQPRHLAAQVGSATVERMRCLPSALLFRKDFRISEMSEKAGVTDAVYTETEDT